MSSSCLSGAGRTYLLDLEILKSPSTSSSIRTPHSSSPSSTLSESSDSPITISTRKPRTTRKRPNQTYSEAAALLSTACPNVFSPKHFTGAGKFPTPLAEPSELLPPFRAIEDSDCLIHLPIIEQPAFRIERRVSDFFKSPVQSKLQDPGSSPGDRFAEEDDFDAESILDEETSDGIDSIMGNPGVENSSVDGGEINARSVDGRFDHGGFGFGFGFGTRAFKGADQGGNPWMFPAVDILQISPRLSKAPAPKKKKKIGTPPASKRESPGGDQQVKLEIPDSPKPESNPTLLLKLNHDEVLKVWSDRASPFSDGISGADGSAKLAEIDLFPAENGGGVGGGGGVREASVLRYKEKRRTRYFSKKIRYQVRKVNADRRPRMKGRFVRRLGNASAAHK